MKDTDIQLLDASKIGDFATIQVKNTFCSFIILFYSFLQLYVGRLDAILPCLIKASEI